VMAPEGTSVRFAAEEGTVWANGMGAGSAPTCGDTYQQQCSDQVTAIADWVVRWSD